MQKVIFKKKNFLNSPQSSRRSLTLTRRQPVTVRSSFTCTIKEGRNTPQNTWTASSVSSSWTRRNAVCTSAGILSASDPVLNLTLNRRDFLPSALRLKVFFISKFYDRILLNYRKTVQITLAMLVN